MSSIISNIKKVKQNSDILNNKQIFLVIVIKFNQILKYTHFLLPMIQFEYYYHFIFQKV